MSKIHEALLKAEQKAEQDSGTSKTRDEASPNGTRVPKLAKPGVTFRALEAFQNEKRPIKIDFDLDPFLEEQYQKLRRRLTPSKHSDVKVIMVAATPHGEGATTTSAILASTLARSGHSKILLIDANMRTPALDSVFEGAPSLSPPGLSDIVAADAQVDTAIYQTNFPNLFLLPVGRPYPSPAYLFDGDPIANLLKDLRERFDYIILDAAPLNGYSESFFLASKVDGVVLVVEAERTQKRTLKKIKKEMEWGQINVLGVVLNKKKSYIPQFLERFM